MPAVDVIQIEALLQGLHHVPQLRWFSLQVHLNLYLLRYRWSPVDLSQSKRLHILLSFKGEALTKPLQDLQTSLLSRSWELRRHHSGAVIRRHGNARTNSDEE